MAIGSWIRPLSGAGAFLILWWLGATVLTLRNPVLSSFSPEAAIPKLVPLLWDEQLFHHVWASVRRVLVGLSIAVSVGLPLGLALGFWRSVDQAFTAVFQFLRMTSPISWMPVAVMVLGIGDPPIYFLVVMGAIWPIVFNVATAIEGMDRRRLLVSKSLGASRTESMRKVVLPSIMPQLLTGCRLALGISWIVLVPAEMLGVRSGLGYMVLMARDRLAYDEVMALILIIGAIGYLLDAAIRLARARYTRYLRPRDAYAGPDPTSSSGRLLRS